MQYSVSMIKIAGVWREMLVLSSAEPVEFDNNIITQQGSGFSVTYYTEGLYKTVEENGVIYYWFVVRSREIRTENTELLNEYAQALNILGVETEEVAADA